MYFALICLLIVAAAITTALAATKHCPVYVPIALLCAVEVLRVAPTVALLALTEALRNFAVVQ